MVSQIEKAKRFWNFGAAFRGLFGLVNGTRISWAFANADYRRAAGTLVRLRIPGWQRAILVRAQSSDTAVFRQLLVNRELEFDVDSPPKRIIDGGANFGLASLMFAQRWPGAEIVAIELERHNFELARQNCAGFATIEVRHAALWGTSGRVGIVNPDAEPQSFRAGCGGTIGSVRAYRIGELLDELGWDRVDLVKLDIEGAERQVLDDGAAWLPRVRYLLVELHDRFEPGCTKAFEVALAGGDWDVRAQGEYLLASRRAV